MKRTWPDDWEARKRGDACHLCGDLSTNSFRSGRTSDLVVMTCDVAALAPAAP